MEPQTMRRFHNGTASWFLLFEHAIPVRHIHEEQNNSLLRPQSIQWSQATWITYPASKQW
jgi:hypothetical protein